MAETAKSLRAKILSEGLLREDLDDSIRQARRRGAQTSEVNALQRRRDQCQARLTRYEGELRRIESGR